MNDSDIKQLHNEAMDEAFYGEIAKKNNDFMKSQKHFKDAFEKEHEVVVYAISHNYEEPGRSILLKSCAALAKAINDYSQAEKLICLALSGNPPAEISEELRNMYEDVTFYRHLQVKNYELQPSEIQVSMAGKGVSYGMGPIDSVMSRLKNFNTLSIRAAERCNGIPFRRVGKPNKQIINFAHSYLSVPKAASLSFIIRYTTPGHYDMGREFVPETEIIDDITKNLSFIENGEYSKLEENIPEINYRNNFISLARELAPDGDDINLFGITSVDSQGNILKTALKKTRIELSTDIDISVADESGESNYVVDEVSGTLKVASDIAHSITIISKGNTKYSVQISDGLSDIVRNYFDEEVVAKVKKSNGNKLELISIDPCD
jgi:hypothetical protein